MDVARRVSGDDSDPNDIARQRTFARLTDTRHGYNVATTDSGVCSMKVESPRRPVTRATASCWGGGANIGEETRCERIKETTATA